MVPGENRGKSREVCDTSLSAHTKAAYYLILHTTGGGIVTSSNTGIIVLLSFCLSTEVSHWFDSRAGRHRGPNTKPGWVRTTSGFSHKHNKL